MSSCPYICWCLNRQVYDEYDQDPDVDKYLKSMQMNYLGKCKDRYIVFDNKREVNEIGGQLRHLMEK